MAEYLQYLLIFVLSFLGVFAGGILALISPEELKAGKKYWIFSKYIFLLLIIAAIFYYSILYSNIITAILISGALIFLKLAKGEYPAFAFVFFFSWIVNLDFLLIIASLIFIYGLFTGTIDSEKFLVHKLSKYNKIDLKKIEIGKMFMQILKNNVLYLIFGIILLPLLAYL